MNSYNSTLSSVDPHPRKNNIVRCNRFIGSAVGIKDKGDSNFIDNATRTNAHPDWANEIYNNLFINQSNAGYYLQQDYVKVHNNIFDSTNIGIRYENYGSAEKVVWQPDIWNNTFINCKDSSIAVQAGPYLYGYNWKIKNNLFIGSSSHYLVFFSGQSKTWLMTSDYNGFDTTQVAVGRYLNYGNLSFSKWQGYGFDTNSINNSLILTNINGNNYTLPADSPAIGKGEGGKDLGAIAHDENNWCSETGYILKGTIRKPLDFSIAPNSE